MLFRSNVRNESFDLDEYVNLANEKWQWRTSISIIILVNSVEPGKISFEEEYNTLSKIFEQINEYGINTIVYLKFIPKEEYSECIRYLETCASTNSTFDDMVRDYNIKVSPYDTNIDFEFEGNTPITITLEEYIKQRKEVN